MTEARSFAAHHGAPYRRRSLAVFACGWAAMASAGDVVIEIEIDPASIVTTAPESHGPLVEMSDLRDSVASERTTIGNVSLGQVEVVPPLPELVGTIVSARAAAIAAEPAPGAADEPAPVIHCGLRRFSIETPATLLYWDIESRIEVVLRVGEQDREVEASARARTWVYPSRKLLQKVTREALVNLAAEVDAPLRELLGAPLPEESVEPAAEQQEGSREP